MSWLEWFVLDWCYCLIRQCLLGHLMVPLTVHKWTGTSHWSAFLSVLYPARKDLWGGSRFWIHSIWWVPTSLVRSNYKGAYSQKPLLNLQTLLLKQQMPSNNPWSLLAKVALDDRIALDYLLAERERCLLLPVPPAAPGLRPQGKLKFGNKSPWASCLA